MIVPAFFVNVICQARIKYLVYAVGDKFLYMPVHYLCGIAGGVRGNGELSAFIGMSVRLRGENDFISQSGEQRIPKRCEFVHSESHRQTYFAAFALCAAKFGKARAFIGVQVRQFFGILYAEPALALVARNKFFAVGKRIHGQAAVVCAAVADRGTGRMCKFFEFFG